MEILRDMISKIKLPKFDLLDGQKRGEVIFRRVFVLLVGALIIYLLLLAFVGKKEENSTKVNAEEKIQLNDGDIVNGQEVSVDDEGKVWFVQEAPEAPVIEKNTEKVSTHHSAQFDAIQGFTESYRGSRIDSHYLEILSKECSDETLRTVVAISVAETGMGRDVNRKSNFFGWFAGGNVNYDPDQETMAKVICKGISENYMGIGSSDRLIKIYTGNSSPVTWKNNYNWAYSQMEVK